MSYPTGPVHVTEEAFLARFRWLIRYDGEWRVAAINMTEAERERRQAFVRDLNAGGSRLSDEGV